MTPTPDPALTDRLEHVRTLLECWTPRDELAMIVGDLYHLNHVDPDTVTDPTDLYETAPGTTILAGPHADVEGAAQYLPLVLAAPSIARLALDLAAALADARQEVERVTAERDRLLRMQSGKVLLTTHSPLGPRRTLPEPEGS